MPSFHCFNLFFDRQRDLWTSERNALVGRGAWGIEIEPFRSVKTRGHGNYPDIQLPSHIFIFFIFVQLFDDMIYCYIVHRI